MTNIFNGVPHDNEAAVALDSNIILFIKSDVLYTYNMTTNSTSNNPLQDTFAEIPTGLTAWLIGAGANNLHSDTQIDILCSDNNFYFYNYLITNGSPTFTFNRITTQGSGHFKTGQWHWGYLGIDTAVNTEEVNTGSLYTKGGSMYLWSGGTNYWANYPSGQGDVLYNGSLKLGEVAYGGTGQPFDGLPHNLDSIFSLPDDVTAYAFKGSMYYKLSLVSQSHTNGVQAVIGGTLDSSGTIPSSGSLLGASAPPTPLPDIVDDKYWDLENDAVAKLGTTILPGFQISDFTPNIIAGNYPQSGTAKEVPSGAAWYLKGIYTEWIQNVVNTWVVSGNTIEFTSNAVNPGVDTNGAAYIGCLGGVALTGTWNPQPFTWEISASNQLIILNTNGSTITFSPLVDLPQPNNFTPAQHESGMFSSSNVGSLNTTALISNSVASFKSPIFPVGIDLTFLSESQVIIRRSWEIVDTTYTVTSSNVLSGQYISPTYPNNGNLGKPPDSYNMPTAWVVLANNDSQFFIEFSGGLNNTITSDGGYSMAVNPVGPSPITYTWTANYYTAADVLISPVVGFGATGSVSSFTIALASVPASAEYILYVCTSSENVQAFASLVIIQAAAAIPFVLDFQNQSAQIVVDATYSVTPNPVDAGTTYAYTATYNNEFDASLGNVLGAVASGPHSSFNFVYANMPTGTKYINYTCNATGGNQGGEIARLSISIIPQIPPAPQPFELEFNGGAYPVNITADGTYSVVPFPTESALIITYTYTANYFAGTTDLGPVVGFDVTGQSSSFPFTFAGMPSGATYIKYICSASGTGLQNGEVAESIIGLVSPSGGGSSDVDLIRSTTGSIIFNQYNSEDSLKLLTGDRIAGLTMTLTDSYGDTLYSSAPVYYELNVRSSNSG